MNPFDELRQALRRTDLQLLRAVRRMRSRPAVPARGDVWGPSISDDGLDELLRQVGEWGPAQGPGQDGASLEASLRHAAALRDTPGTRLDLLRRRLGLSPLDVDILLLALAPDVFEGYGRIMAWLNDFATMPWATVDTAARALETHRAPRLALLGRLLPEAPLVRSGTLVLSPLDPGAPLFSLHRLEVARPVVWELLGLDAALERPVPGGPALDLLDPDGPGEDTDDPESERTEDLPSAVDRQIRTRELAQKWTLFVAPSAREAVEPARFDPDPAQPQPPPFDDLRRPPPPSPGLSAEAALDLSDRLRRADLLVLNAVRQQRTMPWMSESGRGRELMSLSLISDREVQSLLWQRGDPYPRGGTGLEDALTRTEAVRDGAGGPYQALRERCGLLPVDLDILSLALLPEIAAGYKRIFGFLNNFVHDHLNIGLVTRILGEEPEDRLLVRTRLHPSAPLLREGLLTLGAVYPVGEHVAGLRVALAPRARDWLLGQGPAPGRAPGRVIAWSAPRPLSDG